MSPVASTSLHVLLLYYLAKEDGEQLLTGGSDSRLVEWNDHTEEAKREAAERLHEKIAQEQQLANLIQSNHLLPALQLALSLERPLQVLKIIESKLSFSLIFFFTYTR